MFLYNFLKKNDCQEGGLLRRGPATASRLPRCPSLYGAL